MGFKVTIFKNLAASDDASIRDKLTALIEPKGPEAILEKLCQELFPAVRRHWSRAVLESSENSPSRRPIQLSFENKTARRTRPLYIKVTVSTVTRQYLYDNLGVRLYSHLQNHRGKVIGIWCAASCAVAAMRSRLLLHLLPRKKMSHWVMILCHLVLHLSTPTSILFHTAKALS